MSMYRQGILIIFFCLSTILLYGGQGHAACIANCEEGQGFSETGAYTITGTLDMSGGTFVPPATLVTASAGPPAAGSCLSAYEIIVDVTNHAGYFCDAVGGNPINMATQGDGVTEFDCDDSNSLLATGATAVVLDGSLGAKTTCNNTTKTVGIQLDIAGLAADATPDRTADYLITLDATDGAPKKVLLNKLPIAYPLFAQSSGTMSNSASWFIGLYGMSTPSATMQGLTLTSRLSDAGTISKLSVTLAGDPGSGKTYQVCLYDLDATACTALVCTVTGNGSTSVSCADTTHAVTITNISTYNWQTTPGGTPTAETLFVRFVLTPTTPY